MRYLIRPHSVPLPQPTAPLSAQHGVSLAVLFVESAALLLLPLPVTLHVALLLLPVLLLGVALLEGQMLVRQRYAPLHAAAQAFRKQLPSGWRTRGAQVQPTGHRTPLPALALYVTSPSNRTYLLLLPHAAHVPAHPGDDQVVRGVLPEAGEVRVSFVPPCRSRRLVLGFGLARPVFRQDGWTVSVAPIGEQIRRLQRWEEGGPACGAASGW